MEILFHTIAALAVSVVFSFPASSQSSSIREEFPVTEDWQAKTDSNGTAIINNLLIPYSDIGRHIDLCVDGVKGRYGVSINGVVISDAADGRIPAVYDITPYLKFGDYNELAIRSCSLTGSVRLIKTAPVHIAANGTSIRTNWGKVSVSTTLVNDNPGTIRNSSVAVIYSIIGPYGEQVLSSDQQIIELSPSQTREVKSDFSVPVPYMWDFDARYTYRLLTTVYCGNQIVDKQVTPFAFRDIEFHKNRGFLLNNRKVMLVGVNLNSDPYGLGVVVTPELWRYRLERFKNMGFNAVRCTDSPASPEMLDICDEIGLLVIDETFIDGISEEHLKAFEKLRARDANHPSLALWGIGVPDGLEGDDRASNLLLSLSGKLRVCDPQHRFFCVCAAGNSLAGAVDVCGADIRDFKTLDYEHSANPNNFLIRVNSDPSPEEWSFFEARKHLGGFFIDEGKLFDRCADPLEGALFIQTRCFSKSVVGVSTSAGGQVRVFSNCDEVDLVVGNRALARRRVPQSGYVDFPVTGNGASLTARGYKRGAVAVSARYPKPTDAPVFTASKTKMNADGRDVVVFDIQCTQPFDFIFSGPARILGWINRQQTGFAEEYSPGKVTVFPEDGRVKVILQSLSGQRGFVNVYVPGQKTPLVISVI